MKKRLIYIPTVAVLVVIIALLWIDHRQTPAWKNKLDQYLEYLRSVGEPAYQVVNAVQASQPTKFTPVMSTGSSSGSVILPTPDSLDGQYLSSLQPLSYPPDQVWCVLLKDTGAQQLVIVALHTSLYDASWIVHVPPDPWGSPTLQSSLSIIGCNFD